MDIFNLHLVEIIAFISDFCTDSQGSSRKYTPTYAYLTGYHNPYHAVASPGSLPQIHIYNTGL